MRFLNISAYQFMRLSLEECATLKPEFLSSLKKFDVKGTIIVSPEGVNFNLAGEEANLRKWIEKLVEDSRFSTIRFKESYSSFFPFRKMIVKNRRAVIPGWEGTDPNEGIAPSISPERFKQWLDEGKKFTILDTRNRYEVEYGSFEGAKTLPIDQFNQFADASRAAFDEPEKEIPTVMFCTGGVRCEKAAKALALQGFKEVYQLEGGILNYFEQCGGAHYQGTCFVYDERVALDSHLQAVNEK
jgi:UPF0176 protein